MGINKPPKNTKRDPGAYVAIPFFLIQSQAFRALSQPAVKMLLQVATQYSGRNNGRLVMCDKFLKPFGWSSKDTIHKCRKELVEKGFLFQTRQGDANKSSWFALTWHSLDWVVGMDISNDKSFKRSAYKDWSGEIKNSSPPNGVVMAKNASLAPRQTGTR
ncbi:MAG: hypothetical protein LBV44_05770 [Methylobacillus sp.]|jgi:predicted N-acyltransferase|nr:hypothetical protein [Methylobacillus sp.]